MKDVIDSINSSDGLFHDGDQSTGVLGTIVTAKFQNDVQAGLQNAQKEIISILKKANPAIVLDPNATNQLLTALQILFLQTGSNLGDLTDTGAARNNLGLGSSATLNVGVVAGTVAAGNDSRITGALQKNNNLRDLGNTGTARANLGLGSAATQTVGGGANQIPDMNYFTASLSTNGWAKFPNGLIIQWGMAGQLTPSVPDAVGSFNISFPNRCLFMTEHDQGNSAKKTVIQIGYITNVGFTMYNLGVLDRAIPSGLQPPVTVTVPWFAIGY